LPALTNNQQAERDEADREHEADSGHELGRNGHSASYATTGNVLPSGRTPSRNFLVTKLGHVPQLDGLRGIAILLVLGVHTYSPIFSGGSSGVDLFFVLSGFLITKLAFEERDRDGRISLKGFYLRRAFRLLPALLFLLAFLLLLSFGTLSAIGDHVRVEVLFAAGFASNVLPLVLGDYERHVLGHTWSLGLEEQFYWVWPLVLVSVPMAFTQSRRFARQIVIVTLVLGAIGRVVVAGVLDYPHWGSIPLFNADGLAIGCALGILLHTTPTGRRWSLPSWLVYGALAFVLADFVGARFYFEHDKYEIRKVVLRALFAVVIAGVIFGGTRLASLLCHPTLRFFGRISYSLYLWHGPIYYLFSNDRYPEQSRVGLLVLRVGLSVLAALASYHFLEQPALRLRKARFDRRVAPARPAVAVVERTPASASA
jgi:peptidoglycan/LPS O-acetylase OafA/YrhL